MGRDSQYVSCVELETARMLAYDLPYTIQELKENRGNLIFLSGLSILPVSASQAELVTVRQPLLLNQHTEAVDCAVVRVEKELC